LGVLEVEPVALAPALPALFACCLAMMSAMELPVEAVEEIVVMLSLQVVRRT
jgi:hypothetical protein